jgi:hypothetical protein
VGLAKGIAGSSAKLGTTTSLLKQAVTTFFRPFGDFLGTLLRPAAKALFGFARSWNSTVGPKLRAAAEAITGGIGTGIDAIQTGVKTLIDVFPSLDSFRSLPGDALGVIEDAWPGWPDVGALWPGWPNIGELWPGWPDIGMPDLPDWSSLRPPMPDWSGLSLNLPDFLQRWIDGEAGTTPGNTSVGSSREGLLERGRQRRLFAGVTSNQLGGRVTGDGVATVHRGELISDPDRLVNELASAVSQSTGGRSRTMDTSGMERKLDRLHDDLRRLESALDVTLEVGREELARASANGKQDDISDSNPRV